MFLAGVIVCAWAGLLMRTWRERRRGKNVLYVRAEDTANSEALASDIERLLLEADFPVPNIRASDGFRRLPFAEHNLNYVRTSFQVPRPDDDYDEPASCVACAGWVDSHDDNCPVRIAKELAEQRYGKPVIQDEEGKQECRSIRGLPFVIRRRTSKTKLSGSRLELDYSGSNRNGKAR